jgi:flagellar L-ring protein precursor FlgH
MKISVTPMPNGRKDKGGWMTFATFRGWRAACLAGVLAAWTISALAGCSATRSKQPAAAGGTDGAAARSGDVAETVSPDVSEGSLWQQEALYGDLFLTQKARHVGDVVTVRIVESSSASNEASTGTERESSLAAGVTGFWGAENEYAAGDPFFNPFGKIAGNMSSQFEGDGKTSRRGDFTAYISTRVTEVLPNGHLRIKGTREVKINNETQYIHLSGIVRSKDVSSDNIVMSTYVSDAVIEYSGKGIVNDRQRPGWLSNILNTVWPF